MGDKDLLIDMHTLEHLPFQCQNQDQEPLHHHLHLMLFTFSICFQ